MSHTWSNEFVTGTGQRLRNVHDVTHECVTQGCVIHNPTDPRDWPTEFDPQTLTMYRLCPHGNRSIDRDDFAFRLRRGLTIRLHNLACCHPRREVIVPPGGPMMPYEFGYPYE
jgi:hypothetical protein